MNSCSEIRDSIGPWLDGELSGAQADAVRTHTEICLACSQERRQLEKLNSVMNDAFKSQTWQIDPGLFWHGVQERITAKRPWYAVPVECAGRFFQAPAFAWSIPVVILMLISTLYFEPVLRGWVAESPRNGFATVESIDGYGRNVALWRENESKTTVIWIYQNPDSENEGAGEAENKGPAF
jgi:Putative zinc-finger